MAKTVMLDKTHKLFNQIFFIPAMLVGAIDFDDFVPFTDLDLAWGSHGQHRAKPSGFIFSHTFHLIRIEFDVVVKQFKLNILRLLVNKTLIQGK